MQWSSDLTPAVTPFTFLSCFHSLCTLIPSQIRMNHSKKQKWLVLWKHLESDEESFKPGIQSNPRSVDKSLPAPQCNASLNQAEPRHQWAVIQKADSAIRSHWAHFSHLLLPNPMLGWTCCDNQAPDVSPCTFTWWTIATCHECKAWVL